MSVADERAAAATELGRTGAKLPRLHFLERAHNASISNTNAAAENGKGSYYAKEEEHEEYLAEVTGIPQGVASRDETVILPSNNTKIVNG